jgi:hypothetical protein
MVVSIGSWVDFLITSPMCKEIFSHGMRTIMRTERVRARNRKAFDVKTGDEPT